MSLCLYLYRQGANPDIYWKQWHNWATLHWLYSSSSSMFL